MATNRMTIRDYIEYRWSKGNIISNVAVAKALRMGHRTPGIKTFEKIGKTYLLYVNLEELDAYLVSINKPIKLHA